MWDWLVGRIVVGLFLVSGSVVSLFRNQSSTESHRAGGVVVKPYTFMPGGSRLEPRPIYDLSRCNLMVLLSPTKQIPI